jgi:hypothetical protein
LWSAQGQTATGCKPRRRKRLWTLSKSGKRIDGLTTAIVTFASAVP